MADEMYYTYNYTYNATIPTIFTVLTKHKYGSFAGQSILIKMSLASLQQMIPENVQTISSDKVLTGEFFG